MQPRITRSGVRPCAPALRGWGLQSRRRGSIARLLAGGLPVVLLAAFAPASVSAADDAGRTAVAVAGSTHPEPAHHPREKTFLKRQWGVEVMHVRQTAAGYMLEFRYRVLDAEKAKPLFERRTKPVLTHAESGARLIVPTPAKTGALRNSNTPIAGRTYWMVFANPGKLVKPGDHVSVDIGDFRLERAVVR